ncbi:MAG: hypothetical protein HYW01_12800 [Deltaproteobacteria bacterium]|nr:hypothetical protein [Deltaproteobacteria bacterium]
MDPLRHWRWHEVRIALEQATRLNPDNSDAHFFLSMAYYKLDRDRKGGEFYKKAFNLTTQLLPMDSPEWLSWVADRVAEKLKSDV